MRESWERGSRWQASIELGDILQDLKQAALEALPTLLGPTRGGGDLFRGGPGRVDDVRQQVEQLGGVGILHQRGAPADDGLLEPGRTPPHLLPEGAGTRFVGA